VAALAVLAVGYVLLARNLEAERNEMLGARWAWPPYR
jgi:hypothetical protein